MTQYDNTNKGILGKNTRRETDSHPEYNGSINVDGVDYWLSGWVKERKDGTGKFFSLSVKPKEQKAAPVKQGGYGGGFDDVPDDIPF